MPATLGPSASDPNEQNERYPTCSLAVNLASDVDLTQTFACGYAHELYVGGAGNVLAVLQGDNGVVQTYTAVPAGTILRGKWVTVKSTGNGTTATAIVARR